MLQTDDESFKIATTTPVSMAFQNLKSILEHSNHREVYLSRGVDGGDATDFYCNHEGKEIAVQGYLFHAHTAHHYAPILIDVKSLSD